MSIQMLAFGVAKVFLSDANPDIQIKERFPHAGRPLYEKGRQPLPFQEQRIRDRHRGTNEYGHFKNERSWALAKQLLRPGISGAWRNDFFHLATVLIFLILDAGHGSNMHSESRQSRLFVE